MVYKDSNGITLKSVGKWIEGEHILVNNKPRRVYYSKEAGDLYILWKGSKFFYCEFK